MNEFFRRSRVARGLIVALGVALGGCGSCNDDGSVSTEGGAYGACGRGAPATPGGGYLGPIGADGCQPKFRCYRDPGQEAGQCQPAAATCVPTMQPSMTLITEQQSPDCIAGEVCRVPPNAYIGTCVMFQGMGGAAGAAGQSGGGQSGAGQAGAGGGAGQGGAGAGGAGQGGAGASAVQGGGGAGAGQGGAGAGGAGQGGAGAGGAGQTGAGQGGAGGEGGAGAGGAGQGGAGAGGAGQGGSGGDAGAGGGGAGGTCGVNLIVNGGFESLDASEVGLLGEGIIPKPWIALVQTPDTYSMDGMFGLPPDTLGNFTGVMQFAGQRWASAWGVADERFGQPLAAPLEAGQTYKLSLQAHMAIRADLAVASTYAIGLGADADPINDVVEFGTLPEMATPDVWELRELTFVAPADSATRKTLVFRAVTGYAGIDDVTLVRVCP